MIKGFAYALLLPVLVLILIAPSVAQAAEESGSVGIEGKISAPPPKQAATITFPSNGATINESPITVTGICPNGLLVKIFTNNVFVGAAECKNGSYSVKIDLFSGRNELVARVFDDLGQEGPSSNKPTVNFPVNQPNAGQKLSLTSTFAKKGANPGSELIWPIILSGGEGPYAITVDWGDGKTPDVISQQFAGTFNIKHVYDAAGVYTIIVRATDKKGNVAFLQLVGVGNGQVTQANAGAQGGGTIQTRTKILWWPAAISIPLLLSAFWLGRRYELHAIRKRLEMPTK